MSPEEAQHHGPRILRAKAFLCNLRPEPPGRPDLGDLLEEVQPDDQVEGQARAEIVELDTPLQNLFDVGDRTGEAVGDLLDALTLLPDVVFSVDGVIRKPLSLQNDNIHHEP
jgi:hypothetical protein